MSLIAADRIILTAQNPDFGLALAVEPLLDSLAFLCGVIDKEKVLLSLLLNYGLFLCR
jgi:hypothetical protein